MLRIPIISFFLVLAFGLPACSDDDEEPAVNGNGDGEGDGDSMPEAVDPDDAEPAEIDRFSEDAASLMVRTEENGLPDAGEPIDFDEPPFITQGLGPDGQVVRYYNFDVQPTEPAPIYVLFHEGETMPVPDQLNLIDVIPGAAGYNDFWQVHRVTVPEDYVANSVTDVGQLLSQDFSVEATDILVNCPVVPAGSTATLRLGDEAAGLIRGWYRGRVVYYFSFEEAPLMARGGEVPVSPIFVSFNLNPDQEGGGPASGFVVEEDSEQTHNVVATLPGDGSYSPLWSVSVYDNADFDIVMDLASVSDAEILATGVANVNCPVVSLEE